MDLEQRLQAFLDYLRKNTLPDFSEYTQANLDFGAQGSTVEETLLYYAAKIKQSVQEKNAQNFSILTAAYEEMWSMANQEVANTHYADLLDEMLDLGMENENAKAMALQELWEDTRYIKHLDVEVCIRNQKGTPLWLVGSRDKIPIQCQRSRELYALSDEVLYLKNNPHLDPWKFIWERRQNENQNNHRQLIAS